MTFAAEPYTTFVEDLVANLTGGVSRVRFRFVEEELPFRLEPHERVRAATLRVHGIAAGAFTEFVVGRDLDLLADGSLQWRQSAPGVQAAQATWPDAGTDVWVRFDREPGGPPPVLDDRNPGSVVRTLAEAFARELAVLSHQLELVHQAAFVDTASGRDLDALSALVGVERRGATFARGEVVFRRPTPAPADVDVVVGTLVSTARAPLVTVATTETVTLRRGAVSALAPVAALVAGPAGAAPARSLTVVHRPILGVEEVTNPEPLAFGGGPEPDEELRGRVRRALETGGRSTVAAIRGALATLEDIREQDVLVEEDHLAAPGLVRVTVAADLDPTAAIAASRLLEEHRPAGVRIEHNLPAPTTPLPALAADTGGGGDGPQTSAPAAAGADMWERLEADVTVTPADAQLTSEGRDRLGRDVAEALHAAIDALGAGDPVIYNRVVAQLMAVEGVLDVVALIGRRGAGELRRFNVRPESGRRARLDEGDVTVHLRGDRLVLDVSAVVERLGIAAREEPAAALGAIRRDIEQRLVQDFLVTPPSLSTESLLGLLPATEDYRVEAVGYRVELMDEGLRVARPDVELELDPGQLVWVRSVEVAEEAPPA